MYESGTIIISEAIERGADCKLARHANNKSTSVSEYRKVIAREASEEKLAVICQKHVYAAALFCIYVYER